MWRPRPERLFFRLRRVAGWPVTAAALAALIVIATLPPASAQTEWPVEELADAADWPVAVTLEQLVRLARKHSPVLAAERAGLGIGEAQLLQAGLLPNPEIEYEGLRRWRGVNPLDGREDQFVIQQPLLIPGQRRARIDHAEHGLRAAQAEFEAASVELIAELRRDFVGLLARQQRVAYLEELRTDLQRIIDNVAGRVEAGDQSPFDLLRLEIEAATLDTDIDVERAERDEAAAAIGEQLGVPYWAPEAIGELRPLGFEADAEQLWAEAEQLSPELLAAERRRDAAERGIHLARRERIPAPTIGLGALSVTEDRGRAAMMTFSIDLPLFDRGQGQIAEARAEHRVASLEHGVTRGQARARVERAAQLLADRRATLASFEDDVIDQLPRLRERAEDAYVLGQVGIIELLDAFESLVDSRLTAAGLREAVMQAEIDVLEASGRAGDLLR